MRYLAFCLIVCSASMVSAQQLISPMMAKLGTEVQVFHKSEVYMRGLESSGGLAPDLKLQDARLDGMMTELELSELQAQSAFAEGDQYLIYLLRIQAMAGAAYMSALADGTALQSDMVRASACSAIAGESIKSGSFSGWRVVDTPGAYCLDVPDGASQRVIQKAYKALLAAEIGKLEHQIATLKAQPQ